jgi:hypothetical protein
MPKVALMTPPPTSNTSMLLSVIHFNLSQEHLVSNIKFASDGMICGNWLAVKSKYDNPVKKGRWEIFAGGLMNKCWGKHNKKRPAKAGRFNEVCLT